MNLQALQATSDVSEKFFHPQEQRADCLHQLFENTVDATPDRTALVCEGVDYTYLELDWRANRMAWRLHSAGVAAGDKVGVLLERSLETYTTVIAILKLGAAYVPLDASFPAERIAYIAEDAAFSLLVSHSRYAQLLADLPCAYLLLDKETDHLRALPATRPPSKLPDNPERMLCYIIYTSGSTGKPKGVEVEHRSAVNFIQVATGIYGIVPQDRVYQGLSISFDFSIEEIWTTFNAGATLIAGPADKEAALGDRLADFLNAQQVTVLCTVPTLLSLIDKNIPTLRFINVGGEACPPHLVKRWSRPGLRFINTYGPTEATASATWAELSPNRPVTIGRALPTYTIYLLDEAMQPVPDGAIGEIYIGGVGVARGYTNRPQLTAERFLSNPLAREPERLYRSGDLGRLNQEGEIEYLGRADLQVKLRGYRIELGEIESVLLRASDIQAAAVTVARQDDGIEELVAYVVPKASSGIDHKAVAMLLRQDLPAYMIPAYFEIVGDLPTLPSGKINRSALPRPGFHRLIASGQKVAPQGALETAIASVWGAVLGVAQVSAVDDFFLDLGGHSLFAALAVSQLRKQPGMTHVSLSDLYAHPTVQQLAHYLAKARPQASVLPSAHAAASNWLRNLRHLLTGTGQAFALYLLFFLPALMLATVGGIILTENGLMQALGLLGTVSLIALTYPVLIILLAAAVKWLVIGRYRAGSYPLWGSYYFRFWLTGRVAALVPLHLIAGSPLMRLYLRLMGAKVGKHSHIGTQQIVAFDMLEIGAEASVNHNAQLLGYAVRDGRLELGPIALGAGSHVGSQAVVGIHTQIGDNAALLEKSLLPGGVMIPANEAWEGSPARPVGLSATLLNGSQARPARPLPGWSMLAGYWIAAFAVLPLVPALAIVPGLALILYLTHQAGVAGYLVALLPAGLLYVITLSALVVALKRLILPKLEAGVYPVESAFYLRKWLVDKLAETSLLFNQALYATLYLPPFLRMLGAKIGARAEISTVSNITPDLLEIGEETFLADQVSVGAARVHHGHVTLQPVQVGARAFIGNAAALPVGAMVPDGCLIGVLSTPPRQSMPAGSAWVGLPSFFLPRRQMVEGFSETDTYRPSRRQVAMRYGYELLRIILPAALSFGAVAVVLQAQAWLDDAYDLPVVLALLPLVSIAVVVAVTLFAAAVKWLMVGTYRPRVAPLWSHFVRRSEFVTGLYENTVAPLLLASLLGTPFAGWILRLFGVKVGKRAFIATTFFTEFDLVHIGNDAVISHDVSLQTHLFEDRIMKMSHVRVGDGCAVGESGVVLYDTVMEPGSSLGALSLMMKGETLPQDTRWVGAPAQKEAA
ncbi:peptide synthetase [Sulfuriferula plumbiphila]|uniref:Peptide synthetase n=1 Tax=Sulfuriferula plumbiphila TaxID=171865 RepID=A0A512L901_9PROT|nr:Pls/PosA family non-ribosomal peptide synthetase [Sulfuriferula plumbiphila]BBP04429.1 peptide synthetase [Sulfuriferula plumbiphila]GEP30954.1 peptide synthetase [Sulfuriferula plumbiphila]